MKSLYCQLGQQKSSAISITDFGGLILTLSQDELFLIDVHHILKARVKLKIIGFIKGVKMEQRAIGDS